MTTISDDRVEECCVVMHDAYERAAQREGWETREKSRVPWPAVPEENKRTMRAAVRALLEHVDSAYPVSVDYSSEKQQPGTLERPARGALGGEPDPADKPWMR